MESSPLLSSELEGFIEKEIEESSSDIKTVIENKHERESAFEKKEFMQKEDDNIVLSANKRINVVENCFTSDTKQNLSSNRSKNYPFQCSDCESRFLKKASLLLHKKNHAGIGKIHNVCIPTRKHSCKNTFEPQIPVNDTLLEEGRIPENNHSDLNDRIKDDSKREQHSSAIINDDNNTGNECMKHNDISLNTPIKCEICQKAFHQLALLNKHKSSHSRINISSQKQNCKYCNIVFSNESTLEQHLQNHTGEKLYLCDECPKAFRQLKVLERHKGRLHNRKSKKRRPTPVQKPSSETCDSYHSRIIHFDKCSYSEQKNKEVKQDLSKTSNCEEKLATNQQCHNWNATESTTKLNTPIISKSYGHSKPPKIGKETETIMINNKMSNTHSYSCGLQENTKQDKIAVDPKKANTQSEKLFKRVKKSKIRKKLTTDDRTCPHCGLISSSRSTLKIHLRIHTGEKPHKCVECNRFFRTTAALKTHMYSHTGERPYMCGICGQRFKQSQHLKDHKHIHSGERPYECNQCGATFKHYGVLWLHRKKHGTDRHFQCSTCQKKFITKNGLCTHERTHTGALPFKCGSCDINFGSQYRLKTHLMIHTGERPYKCKLCKSAFREKELLHKHMGTHLKQGPFPCTECGIEFARLSSLSLHRKVHNSNNNNIKYIGPKQKQGLNAPSLKIVSDLKPKYDISFKKENIDNHDLPLSMSDENSCQTIYINSSNTEVENNLVESAQQMQPELEVSKPYLTEREKSQDLVELTFGRSFNISEELMNITHSPIPNVVKEVLEDKGKVLRTDGQDGYPFLIVVPKSLMNQELMFMNLHTTMPQNMSSQSVISQNMVSASMAQDMIPKMISQNLNNFTDPQNMALNSLMPQDADPQNVVLQNVSSLTLKEMIPQQITMHHLNAPNQTNILSEHQHPEENLIFSESIENMDFSKHSISQETLLMSSHSSLQKGIAVSQDSMPQESILISEDSVSQHSVLQNTIVVSSYSAPHEMILQQDVQSQAFVLPSQMEPTNSPSITVADDNIPLEMADESCHQEYLVFNENGFENDTEITEISYKSEEYMINSNECRGVAQVIEYTAPDSVTNNIRKDFDDNMHMDRDSTISNKSEHVKVDTKQIIRVFSCSECGDKFKSLIRLKSHMFVHTGVKPYACNLCSASFKRKLHLTIHYRRHTGEKPFKCEECFIAYAHSSTLKKHFISVHIEGKPRKVKPSIQKKLKVRNFFCKYCDKTFLDECYKSDHMKMHKNGQFCCHKCNLEFISHSELLKHINIHDSKIKETNDNINIDKNTLKQETMEETQVKTEPGSYNTIHNYTCILDEVAKNDSILSNSQITLKTPNESAKINVKIGNSSFTVMNPSVVKFQENHNTATNSVETNLNTQIHMNLDSSATIFDKKLSEATEENKKSIPKSLPVEKKIVSQVNLQNADWNMNNEKKSNLFIENQFKCMYCPKTFKQTSGLFSHQRCHTGAKPYSCNICSASFRQITHLKSHMVRHTGIKPYHCDICSLSFSQHVQLKRHERKLHGAPPAISKESKQPKVLQAKRKKSPSPRKSYVCNICNKDYKCSSNYITHKRTHSNERPYECDECSASFKQLGHLKNHYLIHTGEKPFACEFCDHKCIQLTSLKRHIRKIHPKVKNFEIKKVSKSMGDNNNSIDDKRQRNFYCKYCDKTYVDECFRVNHMKKHTNKETIDLKGPSENSEYENPEINIKVVDTGISIIPSVQKDSDIQNKLTENSLIPYSSKSMTPLQNSLNSNSKSSNLSNNKKMKMQKLSQINPSKNKTSEDTINNNCDGITYKNSEEEDYEDNESELDTCRSTLKMNVYKCKECSLLFKWKASLRRHLKMHSKV